MKRLSVLSLAALCALSASAAVKFASPFGDGMVLQRGKSVAVWGTADAGEKVNVAFAGQSASATAGADGRWLVRLAPMEACAEGRVLAANGAEVKDVNRYMAILQQMLDESKEELQQILDQLQALFSQLVAIIQSKTETGDFIVENMSKMV